jgi:hypothetical protein
MKCYEIFEAPLKVEINNGVPEWLIRLVRIDTKSSQWRKTKKGSIKTDELKAVQTALDRLGYNPGKIDGWFGRKTARAVMKFQQDNALTVDGDPGKNTIAKMINIGKSRHPAAKHLYKQNVDQKFPVGVLTGDMTAMLTPAELSPRLDTKGETPAATFDPNSLEGKTVQEVVDILTRKIREKRWKDALAIMDYDMRLNISDKFYNTVKGYALEQESVEEQQELNVVKDDPKQTVLVDPKTKVQTVIPKDPNKPGMIAKDAQGKLTLNTKTTGTVDNSIKPGQKVTVSK